MWYSHATSLQRYTLSPKLVCGFVDFLAPWRKSNPERRSIDNEIYRLRASHCRLNHRRGGQLIREGGAVSAFGPPVNLAVAEPASVAARRCRFVKNAKAAL